jgi:hypothetical protein
MFSIGYGDIHPQTTLEKIFTILFLLIANFVYAFTINSIGSALQQINERHEEYR